MKIRRATIRDAKRVCEFMHAMRMERPPTLFRRDSTPTIEEERTYIAEANKNGVFIICTDAKIVGMIGASIPSREQRAHTCEFGMSVLRTHRGKGIGTRLLKSLEAWAISRGLRRIECAAFSNNTKGIRLYKRMGYAVEGRRKGAIEVNGRYLDIIELGKHL